MATIQFAGSIGYHRRNAGTGAAPLEQKAASSGLECKIGDALTLVSNELELCDFGKSDGTEEIYGVAAQDYPASILPDGGPEVVNFYPVTPEAIFHIKTASGTNFADSMVGSTYDLSGDASGGYELDISTGGTEFIIDGLMTGFEAGNDEVRVYGRFLASSQYMNS